MGRIGLRLTETQGCLGSLLNMKAESPNMKPPIRDFSEGSPDRDLVPTALGEAHLGSFKARSGVIPASGFWPVKCLL